MSGATWSWQLLPNIKAIGAAQWQQLMQPTTPFNSYGFLYALEASGCVGAPSGWQPQHLALYRQAEFTNDTVAATNAPLGELVAILPLYQKSHSYGEYVFDWSWADAYEQYQLAYYPKLVSAIPFTPVTGERLGISAALSEADNSYAQRLIQTVLQSLLAENSSFHGLFLSTDEIAHWQQAAKSPLPLSTHQAAHNQAAPRDPAKLITREGCQYHWFNRGYHSFDDFLATLTSNKRKNLRKERRQASEWDYRWRTGAELTSAIWRRFYDCYRMTYLKRSGHNGYLNQAFFELLGELMPDSVQLLLVCGHGDADEDAVACALYFHTPNDDTLYGRYWGCLAEYDTLHFEACYYQGIDYCIAKQLRCFNAGAQGEHKVLRGFEPVLTQSVHLIADPRFEAAIADFCHTERVHNQQAMAQLRDALPYKQPT